MGLKTFSLFLGQSHPVLAKYNIGNRSFNFFAIFFEIFLLVFSMSGIRFFFSPFFGLSHPVSAKNNVGKRFFKFFEIFCNFFRNFLNRIEFERNSGLKFLSLFHGLSHPLLARNNAGKRFFNFLNFFAIYFEIFLCGSGMNGIGA